MEAFIAYISAHWLEWLFALILAVLGFLYRSLVKKVKEQRAASQAIAEGVQALLRDSIVGGYNKYSDKGFCPIYAKESLKQIYRAYHALGGNDVATALYEKLLAMPEEGRQE